MECTCGEKRTYTMAVWGRHFEGCPIIRKWPGLGVPAMMLAVALVLGCTTLIS